MATYPGDDFIPSPVMLYDQKITISAPASSVFPWLLQLGKGRAGWYLPSTIEQYMPTKWRASRSLNPAWHNLAPGDRIADYGFGEDYFDVVAVDAPTALVYRSERYGCAFSWALLVHEHQIEGEASDRAASVVHLRFRGSIEATGLKRWVIVKFGGFMDYISTAPMLAGLKERVEKEHVR